MNAIQTRKLMEEYRMEAAADGRMDRIRSASKIAETEKQRRSEAKAKRQKISEDEISSLYSKRWDSEELRDSRDELVRRIIALGQIEDIRDDKIIEMSYAELKRNEAAEETEIVRLEKNIRAYRNMVGLIEQDVILKKESLDEYRAAQDLYLAKKRFGFPSKAGEINEAELSSVSKRELCSMLISLMKLIRENDDTYALMDIYEALNSYVTEKDNETALKKAAETAENYLARYRRFFLTKKERGINAFIKKVRDKLIEEMQKTNKK